MKKCKILRRVICCIIAAGVIITCPRNVYASNSYNMDEYLNVIEQFNEENGCDLEITDMEQFMDNVYNAGVSPDALYNLIKGDSLDQTTELSETEDANQISPMYLANQNIEYDATITCGSWSTVVFATIETQYLYSGATNFVKYLNGGSYYSKYDTSYKFVFTETIRCTSLTAKACTVKYVGNWKVPATGLTDMTTRTYTITYYAK